MRFLAALLLTLLLGLAAAHAMAQSGDNFAPATDDDVKRLVAALSQVPVCSAGGCPQFSCPAVAALDAALVDVGNDIFVLDRELRVAVQKIGDLLDHFVDDYKRQTDDDEKVRTVQIVSKAFLTAGKIYLDVASLLYNVKSVGDLATGASDPGALNALATALLITDRGVESASSAVSITDDFIAVARRDPLLKDDMAQLQLKKSGVSDVGSAIVGMRDALRELTKAHQAGDAAAIASAQSALRKLEKSRGNVGQLLGKLLVAIAELRLKELADRLLENARLEAAANAAFAEIYRGQARLLDRVVRLTETQRLVDAARSRIRSCAMTCSEWPQASNPLQTKGKSYGELLKLYNPRIAQETARITAAVAELAFKPGQPPTLAVAPPTVAPNGPAWLEYALPQCKATQGAKIRLTRLSDGFVAPLAVAEAGQPMTQAFFAPGEVGKYEVKIVGAEEATLVTAPFAVEIPVVPDKMEFCGLTLRKGIYSPDYRQGRHLKAKKFKFTLGEAGTQYYVKGVLTVTPGMGCRDGAIAFPIFGGVSREPEFFQVQVDAGDISNVKYLEQWFGGVRVKFDTGAVETGNDDLMGVKIPPGAKGVQMVEMTFDGGGANAKAILTWYPD